MPPDRRRASQNRDWQGKDSARHITARAPAAEERTRRSWQPPPHARGKRFHTQTMSSNEFKCVHILSPCRDVPRPSPYYSITPNAMLVLAFAVDRDAVLRN